MVEAIAEAEALQRCVATGIYCSIRAKGWGRTYMDMDYTVHKLWIDYLVWVKDYIFLLMLRQSGMQYVEERLMRLTTEIVDFLMPYYGEQVAKQFGDLMKRHIGFISQYVAVVQSNEALEPIREALYADIDEMARLFASINPYWDETTWRTVLQNESYLEESMILALHHNGYGEAIAQYDDIYANTEKIIAYMTDGIKKQFGSDASQGVVG